jgi:hypothetical protein
VFRSSRPGPFVALEGFSRPSGRYAPCSPTLAAKDPTVEAALGGMIHPACDHHRHGGQKGGQQRRPLPLRPCLRKRECGGAHAGQGGAGSTGRMLACRRPIREASGRAATDPHSSLVPSWVCAGRILLDVREEFFVRSAHRLRRLNPSRFPGRIRPASFLTASRSESFPPRSPPLPLPSLLPFRSPLLHSLRHPAHSDSRNPGRVAVGPSAQQA